MRVANIGIRITAACSLPLLLLSCSLPTDDGVTPINADELPPVLANTTTTAPPTTTTTTTTVPSSVPEDTEPSTSTSTSTVPTLTTPVSIYYTDDVTDGMRGLRRLLTEFPVTLRSVITQLESPPPDLASYNVSTSLVPGLVGPTELERAVLTVSLNGAVFDPMSDDQKREAIAQMVLTFTSFEVPGEGNIGSVIMQVDGTPIPVYLPAPNTTAPEGTPLIFDDFSTLIVGTPGDVAPATSAPPTETAPPTATSEPAVP